MMCVVLVLVGTKGDSRLNVISDDSALPYHDEWLGH